jgi:drug/metabolite transporter (DMT)-like permease
VRRNDFELVAVVLIWAFNLPVVKVGLREIEPLAYNIVRFVCASAVLLALVWRRERSFRVERRDLGRLLLLGVVGHAVYQICFIEGLAHTTASSTALLFGSTPVVVGLMSRLAGHERVGLTGAAGALLGFAGVALIVSGRRLEGPAPAAAGSELLGNVLIVAAVLCWSLYTVLARRLLQRYSPLRVTALSLAIGTALLIPPALPQVMRQRWGDVSAAAWAGLAYSFLFALVVAYVIWYRSVQRVGNLRTAVYSNLVPVFGTLFGVWLLDESLTASLWSGALCILVGIVLTRRRGRGGTAPSVPAPAAPVSTPPSVPGSARRATP